MKLTPTALGCATSLALALSAHAAANTWNNSTTGVFAWDATYPNWTSPTTWVDGDDAIFGPVGVGSIYLLAPVQAHSLTFNAPGYQIDGYGFPLTLTGTNPTITNNANAAIAATLAGANGLIVRASNGNTNLTLLGDPNGGLANTYTGGTYIRSGTVILQATGAGTGTTPGSSHAVDSIEALDAGATLVIPGTWNGVSGATSVRDQVAGTPSSRLNMTGGTLDFYNDQKNQRVPAPEGTGLIINSGPNIQSGLQVLIGSQDKTFAGVIADGNNGVLATNNNFNGGPGYQIGILQVNSGLGGSGGTWTLTGSNTFSGSTRIDAGTGGIKLAGNGTIGFPSPNGLTGPLRIYNGFLDLNGHNQTIALMTGGNTSGRIINNAVGTVSTLTIGYGNEQADRNAPYIFRDNDGTGGILALRKINSAPYLFFGTTASPYPYVATNCIQGLSATAQCTYSGDTTIEGGTWNVQGTGGISPNTAYRLSTNNYALLKLSYTGTANCRQLWINGVQRPNGVYGAGTPGIDPASTGTITVTGYAPVALGVTQSANALNLSWAGVYKLQTTTNNILGPWYDYPGGSTSPVSVPLDKTKRAAFFRLSTH